MALTFIFAYFLHLYSWELSYDGHRLWPKHVSVQ